MPFSTDVDYATCVVAQRTVLRALNSALIGNLLDDLFEPESSKALYQDINTKRVRNLGVAHAKDYSEYVGVSPWPRQRSNDELVSEELL